MSSRHRLCAGLPWSSAVLFALAAATLLLAGCPGRPGGLRLFSADRPSDVVALLKDATVLIEVKLLFPDGAAEGTGSGFVVDDGLLVTNAHVVSLMTETDDGRQVVAQDREIRVVFHAGTEQERTLPAQVARENHLVDLAVLKIEDSTPARLALADSDTVRETSKIYVAGHPLGLRELSITTGTVTAARRTFNDRVYIEHDAQVEQGNSGGPVVGEDGRVLGVQVAGLATQFAGVKFAIPAHALREWLASDPGDDPAPPRPGAPVLALLREAELKFSEVEDGLFELPYDNDINVYVHQVQDFLRVFVPLGHMPGLDEFDEGEWALEALRFNYSDPVGRLSLFVKPEAHQLYWESQIPYGAATPQYVATLCRIAAHQAERWQQMVEGEDANDPDELYPGGDEAQQFAQLGRLLDQAGLKYEQQETFYKLPYDNDVTVFAKIYQGVAYIHSWTGGMPGAEADEKGRVALQFLQRNWDDPFGRLALDSDGDVAWESQVPLDFLTPDYLRLLTDTCATQVAAFLEEYGHVPFAG